MAVITTGQTSDIEYDVKALISKWAINRFLYKVSSLKTMQVELFSDESFLNSCELLYDKDKDKLCILLFQRNCL